MVTTYILIFIVLTILNGLLAMSELAVVSSRRARLQALEGKGVAGASMALRLFEDPSRFLSTVQIGITLVGIIAGAFSGATLGNIFAEWLMVKGVRPDIAEPVGMGSVIVLITYITLIFGELVPKQLALRNPERVAAFVSPIMMLLAKLAAPFVWLLSVSGRAVLMLFGSNNASGSIVTEEEIKIMVAEAETAGVLEPEERRMITGILRLNDRTVRAVMTPRLEVGMVDISLPPEEIRKVIHDTPYSRLPAYDGSPDGIIGVLSVKDVLNAYLRGEEPDMRACILEVPSVPDNAYAMDILETMKSSPLHMALVLDEYGDFEGIVTAGDILSAITGVVHTTVSGGEGALATRREDGSWLISGAMPVDEFSEILELYLPEDRDYQTAAGLILTEMKRLPIVGDKVNYDGWCLEVVDMDGRRIDKILASQLTGAVPRRVVR